MRLADSPDTTTDARGDLGRYVAGREATGRRVVVPLVDPADTFEALRPTQEQLLRQIGIGPDRRLGPNWKIVDGLAHHVNDRPTDPGLPVVLGDDGEWRLA